MTTSKLVKTIIFIVLLIVASVHLGITIRQIGQMGDTIFFFSVGTLYPFLWLLLSLVLVAVTAGLVTALVRPVWMCFIAFALASLAVLFTWGLSVIGTILAVIYLLAGLLYSWDVAKGLNERIRFSVHTVTGNNTILITVLIIAACAFFYSGYWAQIESEGFTTPPFVVAMATGIAEVEIESSSDLSPQEKEQAKAELIQQFEQKVEEMIKPYQKFVPIVTAVILLGILLTISVLLSWLPTLILRAVFAILAVCNVTSLETETQEIERLVID